MQRLLEAAKAVLKRRGIARYGMASTRGEFDAARVDDDFHQLDAAISEAEQQAADDALPITPEWMCELSGTQMPMIEVVREVIIHMIGDDVYLNVAMLPRIRTRGQLRDLIKALKGGEA